MFLLTTMCFAGLFRIGKRTCHGNGNLDKIKEPGQKEPGQKEPGQKEPGQKEPGQTKRTWP
jgi:hypothetical protein